MRKGLTEMIFIIDRSGSMSGMEQDTIGGFNSMIAKQQHEEGDAYVNTVLFSDRSKVIHDRVDIKDIRSLTEKDYTVNGGTALYDAIGDAIHHIGNIHKYARREDIPEHTVVIITTDGEENSSRRYSMDKIRRLIENQKKKYGWEFIFIGADISTMRSARNIGIDSRYAAVYRKDHRGTAGLYDSIDFVVGSIRRGEEISEEWAKALDDKEDKHEQN